MNPIKYLRIYLVGFAMGSADLVPGVSGGTIAFISGIYEKLIQSIKYVTSDFLSLLVKRQFKQAFDGVPFSFLIPLALGIFSAIFLLSSLIGYLLLNKAIFTWSFFLGLVLASIYIVSRKIKTWNTQLIVSLMITSVLAFIFTGLVPATTPSGPLAFFLSGAIAIIAMILPGVSGSFLLIILGKYQQVLNAVHDRDFITLGIFMCGAVIGLALFSKLLNYLFKHHHDITIAALTGFMIGSLRRIWPWKEVTQTTIVDGVEEAIAFRNLLPAVNAELASAIICIIFGAALIILLESQSKKV